MPGRLKFACRSTATFGLAAIVAFAGGVAGCESTNFTPRGNGFSNDRFTWESTAWSPKTIELVDTRNEQTLWSIDIPVGQKLTVNFDDRSRPNRDAVYPDRMEWVVQPITRNSWAGKQEMLVPPADARLLEMTLRSSPELPSVTAGTPEPPALEPEPADRPDADENGLETDAG